MKNPGILAYKKNKNQVGHEQSDRGHSTSCLGISYPKAVPKNTKEHRYLK